MNFGTQKHHLKIIREFILIGREQTDWVWLVVRCFLYWYAVGMAVFSLQTRFGNCYLLLRMHSNITTLYVSVKGLQLYL